MPDTTTRTDDAALAAAALQTMSVGAPDEYRPAMERVADRLDPDLDAARAALSRDEFLDAPGPTIHLNGEIADALLTARGWQIVKRRAPHRRHLRGGEYSVYVAPDGERYWERDEALRLALVAEALAS